MDRGSFSGRSPEGLRESRLRERRWQQNAQQLLVLPPLMFHVGVVLAVGWIASRLEFNLLFVFTLGFAYLCFIEKRKLHKIEARIRSEVRKSTDRKRLLSDVETARWLNNVLESIWPIFLERFVSNHFLMRLAPWFLDKYKPWTAKKILLQNLNLGRSPPVFTSFRAGRHPTEGDHLVLEMAMNFTAARDMTASMAVQMKKRIGLGIWASFHVSDLQIEGHLKVGVRFVQGWPVLGRLRICFSEPPVIRMVAKPVFPHGVDVTDLPGIAAWLDKMIIDVLEQSLVEPNLLVVDVEKLVGNLMSVNTSLDTGRTANTGGDWFSAGKETLAILLVEILEAEKLKPCDPNGRADPYVKIILGSTERRTTIKRKTLYPAWHEQFRIPIESWALPNHLILRVRDKDRFVDDEMGYKEVHISDFKNGERHDMWLVLDGVKTGRLHVALTVKHRPAVNDEQQTIDNSPQLGESTIPSSTSSEGEDLGSDIAETPAKNEFQTVDVGVGELGCISILQPGQHVVHERYSPERLSHRKKYGRDLRDLDIELDKSASEVENIHLVQLGLVSSQGKKSRMRNLWARRLSREKKTGEDPSAEKPGENKFMMVGNKGTQVHTTLEMDDEEEIESPKLLGSPNDVTLAPKSGELEQKREDADKTKLKRATVKNMGRGVLKQASKTAHNIGGAFKKIHSGSKNPDSPNSMSEDSPMDHETIVQRYDEDLVSRELIPSKELSPGAGVLDQQECMANEGQKGGDPDKEDRSPTPPQSPVNEG